MVLIRFFRDILSRGRIFPCYKRGIIKIFIGRDFLRVYLQLSGINLRKIRGKTYYNFIVRLFAMQFQFPNTLYRDLALGTNRINDESFQRLINIFFVYKIEYNSTEIFFGFLIGLRVLWRRTFRENLTVEGLALGKHKGLHSSQEKLNVPVLIKAFTWTSAKILRVLALFCVLLLIRKHFVLFYTLFRI